MDEAMDMLEVGGGRLASAFIMVCRGTESMETAFLRCRRSRKDLWGRVWGSGGWERQAEVATGVEHPLAASCRKGCAAEAFGVCPLTSSDGDMSGEVAGWSQAARLSPDGSGRGSGS